MNDPTIRYIELLLGAHHAATQLGDYMGSLIMSATACEMLVRHFTLMSLWEQSGRVQRLPRSLRDAKPLELLRAVREICIPGLTSILRRLRRSPAGAGPSPSRETASFTKVGLRPLWPPTRRSTAWWS